MVESVQLVYLKEQVNKHPSITRQYINNLHVRSLVRDRCDPRRGEGLPRQGLERTALHADELVLDRHHGLHLSGDVRQGREDAAAEEEHHS